MWSPMSSTSPAWIPVLTGARPTPAGSRGSWPTPDRWLGAARLEEAGFAGAAHLAAVVSHAPRHSVGGLLGRATRMVARIRLCLVMGEGS